MRPLMLAVLTLSTGTGTALAADPHVHGTAFLDVAVDGGQVLVSLRGAGDGFVGFEHAPGNADERRRFQAAADTLRNGTSLFAFTAAAGCSRHSARVELPETDDHEHDHPGHDHDHGHDDPEHASAHSDWSAQWTFRCRAPAALHELRADLFDAFPGLSEVRVQFLSATFQTGATLTPSARRLALVPAKAR